MKVDFRFSPEGDLVLGAPSYNDFGELLYVDAAGEISTEEADGELIRDIAMQVSSLVDKQVIINRLKTDDPDWVLHPDIGSNLSDLIGLPNTRETGDLGVELIERSLCGDGYINETNLSVRPVPVSSEEILFYITVNFVTGDLVLPILYNLEHGILSEYEVTQ